MKASHGIGANDTSFGVLWDSRDVRGQCTENLGDLEPLPYIALMTSNLGASHLIYVIKNRIAKYDTTSDSNRRLGKVRGVAVDIGVVIVKLDDADVLREAIVAQTEVPFVVDSLEADANPYDALLSPNYRGLFLFFNYFGVSVTVAGLLLVFQTTRIDARYKAANTLMKQLVIWPVIIGSLIRSAFWSDPFGILGS